MSTPDPPSETLASKNRRVTRRLFLVVGGMFAFGFAMVPLYQLACDIGGINGVAGTPGGRMTDTSAITHDRHQPPDHGAI